MSSSAEDSVSPGDWNHVLVGVSGGADSLFCALYLAFGESLVPDDPTHKMRQVTLFNAKYLGRGDEADEDIGFLQKFADRFQFSFSWDSIPAGHIGRTGNLEADLRDARYDQMKAHAKKIGAQAIALGHHQDDVAETLMIMALRGSGPRGLGSMQAIRSVEGGLWFWRPLLKFSRAEIRERLSKAGLNWREDSMNADGLVRRNILRHQIFPLLEKMELSTKMLFARSSQLCAEEHQLAEEFARHRLAEIAEVLSPELIVLKSEEFLLLSEPLQRGILRSLVAEKSSVSFNDLMSLIEAITSDSVHENILAFGENTLHLYSGKIYIYSNQSALVQYFEFCNLALFDQKNLSLLEQSDDCQFTHHLAAFSKEVWECSRLLPLESSDTIQIEKGTRRCFDLLQEKRIPASLRSSVLALKKAGKVLWIPGIRRAATHYVDDSTSAIFVKFETVLRDTE